MQNKSKTREISLQYAQTIASAPVDPKALHQRSCSADGTTIEFWRETWVKQIKANWDEANPFHRNSLGALHGIAKHKPVIVAGAGPSLKYNVGELKDRNGMLLVSCLHNFAFMEDNEAAPDYYVTLDAGEITIPEVYEGGKESPEWYWERTKDRKLIAFIGSNPELIEKWRGDIYWFNCPVGDEVYNDAIKPLGFNLFIGTGGNVLGASLYIAKGIFGANPIAFIGADFSFARYDVPKPMFHSWDSNYDTNIGSVIQATDIFGNSVVTWPSYYGFKCWFDYVCSSVPGIYVNCTEGGILGAYHEGVIAKCPPMDLSDFLEMYNVHRHTDEQCRNPKTENRVMLF